MMQDIVENALITRLAQSLPHHPAQINRIQESDAELIPLPGSAGQILAVTTDSIVEEVESGMYDDPHLLGWMTVMANCSDLAAVGATPIGLLIAETIPGNATASQIEELQNGIRDACRRIGTCVLGGDTNFSDRFHTTATAIGLIADGAPLLRVHCSPGDVLFSSGPMGAGNAFAALKLFDPAGAHHAGFAPVARLREGAIVRHHASACMDSSDGLLATLDQLGRLNNCGFLIENGWDGCIDPATREVASHAGLSPWMLLAGPHGEFELVFTVPPDRTREFLAAAAETDWIPLRLGTITASAGVAVENWGRIPPEDLATLRNYTFSDRESILQYPRFLADLATRRETSTKQ
jgi:thiamine-monophosphate kinase